MNEIYLDTPPISRQKAQALSRQPWNGDTWEKAAKNAKKLFSLLGLDWAGKKEEVTIYLWADCETFYACSLTYDSYQGWNCSFIHNG